MQVDKYCNIPKERRQLKDGFAKRWEKRRESNKSSG